jgi:hypothetical protein
LYFSLHGAVPGEDHPHLQSNPRVNQFNTGPPTTCIYDAGHSWTQEANNYLHEHEAVRKVTIILSSLHVDIAFILIVLFFLFLAKSARIIYLTLFFYTIRGICQGLFMFQYPKDWIFDDPGVFSLMVPYQKASDFYYSGHSGFLMMSTLEFIQMRMVSVAFLNFLLMLFTGWMLITTRAHYTIGTKRLTKMLLSAGHSQFTPTESSISTRNPAIYFSGDYLAQRKRLMSCGVFSCTSLPGSDDLLEETRFSIKLPKAGRAVICSRYLQESPSYS